MFSDEHASRFPRPIPPIPIAAMFNFSFGETLPGTTRAVLNRVAHADNVAQPAAARKLLREIVSTPISVLLN
jgi:hypothetical protein